MNADDVARFLRLNPQFFDQHPELLESIHVPHPYGGRAIPLAERQTVALREKVKAMESKLGELVKIGEDNDAIGEKVHRLAVALVAAGDFAALTQALYYHLREDFAVPHVALRVWGRNLPAACLEGSATSEAQRRAADTMGAPQCGPAAGNPFLGWFSESSEHVRSLALIPLGQSAVFGLLALGAEDPARFYAEMGTLYLRRIGEICAAGIAARL